MVSTSIEGAGEGEIREISRDEIRARLRDRSLTLVNVLTREAFKAARIPGSLNLPVAEVESRAGEVLPERSSEIAIYCGSPT